MTSSRIEHIGEAAPPCGNSPISTYALRLSRRIWNLNARLERGENVEAELAEALRERAQHRAREL